LERIKLFGKAKAFAQAQANSSASRVLDIFG